jgi:hypothetical protein
MTPEKLQHAFDQPQTGASKCERTILVNSATEMQMHVDCTDVQGTHQMTVKVQAPNPEAIAGTMNLVTTRNGKTFTIVNNLEGKRVAADCGGVTDIQPIN